MKKQVVDSLPSPPALTPLACVNDTKYYGVQINLTGNGLSAADTKYYGVQTNLTGNGLSAAKGERGFITRTNYMSGKYIVLSSHRITKGNGWTFGVSGFDFLHDCVSKVLEKDDFFVFEFDTPRELFQWISENS